MAITIFQKILIVLENHENQVLTRSQLIEKLQKKFKINPASVIPSDYCYNRLNDGIKFEKHLFQYKGKNEYKYLGENFRYTGKIYHRKKSSTEDEVAGEWNEGRKTIFSTGLNLRNLNKILGLPVE